MHQITGFLEQTLGISPDNQIKILYSILIFVGLGVLRFGILKIVWRVTEDPRSRYSWKRSVSFIIGFLTVILIGSVWIKAIGQFGAFLGLLTAGLAIAMKDPLTNIAGWIFILFRHPFNLGDRIQIGEHSGDVIDIRMFQFTLLEIVTEHAADLSADAEKKIIEASKKYMIFYQYLTPIVYTTVQESGVLLTMRYICDPRRRRITEHEIWEDVLARFALHKDIEFAYPTQRFFTRPAEKDDSPI